MAGMVPIVVDGGRLSLGLAGEGERTLGRLNLLARHGVRPAIVFAPSPTPALAEAAGALLRRSWPGEAELRTLDILLACDLPADVAERIAAAARSAKTLINVEDERARCDFHMPAAVRRGALLLTASSDGEAPGLSRLIAGKLEASFGPEWAERVASVAEKRKEWRAAGLSPAAVTAAMTRFVEDRGWIA